MKYSMEQDLTQRAIPQHVLDQVGREVWGEGGKGECGERERGGCGREGVGRV